MAVKKTIETEMIFGVHPILELLKAKKRRIVTIYTTKPEPKSWKIISSLLPKGTQIQYVDRTVLHRMAQTNDHQSIIAFAAPFAYRKTFFSSDKEKFIVMLDGVQDPRNLGAILRSAYCTGVDGVILVKRGGALLTASAIKASAGLSEHLAIYIASSAQQAINLAKTAHYEPYLAVLQNGTNALQVDYKLPICLVIGSEEIGISPDIRSSGKLITLPQRVPDISYNASVAAGILLFTIAHKVGKIS